MASSEIDFHPDAHPEAKEITGDANYGEWGQCIASRNKVDERCGGHAKGPHGKCHSHGGSTPSSEENPDVGRGQQDRNQNATKHSLHARKVNAVYQKVFSPEIQDLVDSIYEDYIEDYRDRHGEPRTGDKAELFRIAVSYGKHVHSEEWAIEKPDDLESGNAMVDKETSYKTAQNGDGSQRLVEEQEYKQTVVQKGQQSLSQDRRMWLKDLGLLDSPEDRQADATETLADAWTTELERGTTQ